MSATLSRECIDENCQLCEDPACACACDHEHRKD